MNNIGNNNVSGSCVVGGSATSKNVINSIMSFLPDNRPITSLQIVEDYEKCPKNFTPIHRTYDQDADADLWRETNILFGRQTTRYLCLSKTEGLPDYVLDTLIITTEKTAPPQGFSLLSRTADTEQKAWRKRQLSYKLSKKYNASQAITDIILCSKLKTAPQGFKMAGDVNGILICYKTVPLPSTKFAIGAPLSQIKQAPENEVERFFNHLNLSGANESGPFASANSTRGTKQSLPPITAIVEDHDYEEIQASYRIKSPQRPAPTPPIITTNNAANNTKCIGTNTSSHNIGTLSGYTEVEGVPFVINPILKSVQQNELHRLPKLSDFTLKAINDYDFQLERQILCIMKATTSKNPFFR